MTASETAYVAAAWQAIPEQRRLALLHHDRVQLVRWVKGLLRERTPALSDALATRAACLICTELFGH